MTSRRFALTGPKAATVDVPLTVPSGPSLTSAVTDSLLLSAESGGVRPRITSLLPIRRTPLSASLSGKLANDALLADGSTYWSNSGNHRMAWLNQSGVGTL